MRRVALKRKVIPCACGCGKEAPIRFVDGRNKGRRKYIPGHAPPPALCNPDVRKKALQTSLAKIPIGTRREQSPGKGRTSYWQIKTGRGRWPLEHRWIIEQELKRTLRRDEHVHHLNGDGLDNSRENLQLLSASEHATITSTQLARDGIGMFSPDLLCNICGWRHPPHPGEPAALTTRSPARS